MNLPSEFENYTRDLLGDALYSRLREGLAEAPSPTSIRLNPFKAASREVNGLLMESVVPWCPATGRYLNERPNFTFDPLFHAGAYYVQEAGSMLVDLAYAISSHNPYACLTSVLLQVASQQLCEPLCPREAFSSPTSRCAHVCRF